MSVFLSTVSSSHPRLCCHRFDISVSTHYSIPKKFPCFKIFDTKTPHFWAPESVLVIWGCYNSVIKSWVPWNNSNVYILLVLWDRSLKSRCQQDYFSFEESGEEFSLAPSNFMWSQVVFGYGSTTSISAYRHLEWLPSLYICILFSSKDTSHWI